MSRPTGRLTAALLAGAALLVITVPAAAELNLGEPKPLTAALGRTEKPTISPDGGKIAFVAQQGGVENLWVLDFDDGQPRQVTHQTRADVQVGSPAWGPRGDFLVYTSNQGETGSFDLWITSADGQHNEPLTVDPGLDWMPAWSPDGRQIAFVSDRDGADGVWLIGIDGTGLRKVIELAYEPAWSPDGSTLAVYHITPDADGIYLVRPDASANPRLLLPGGRMPAFSPDGRYLLAVTDRLQLVDVARGAARALGGAMDQLAWPVWGARGPTLAFEANLGGGKQIYLAPLTQSRAVVALLEPQAGASVRGNVAVSGRIGGTGQVGSWRLEYGAGASPNAWTLIREGTGSLDGPLGTWATDGLEGTYTLRLTTLSETGESTVAAVPVTVYGQYGSVWSSQTFPATMTTAGLYEAAVTVRNTGSMTWRKDGPYAIYGSYQWIDGLGRIVVAEGIPAELPSEVATGESVTLQARVLAPPIGGAYTLRYDLRQGGQVWFHEQGAAALELPVTVAVPYGVAFQIPSVPPVMVPGQIYTVEVRISNYGSATWAALGDGAMPGAETVQVISRWRSLEGNVVDAAPLETPLRQTVAPGETVILPVQVQAPAVNGMYILSFDLRDSRGSFSQRMAGQPNGVEVTVASPYDVDYLAEDTPGRMFPGDIVPVNLQVRNAGSVRWRSSGQQPIKVTYRWLDRDGQALPMSGIETDLPYDVMPGMVAAVSARVQAPGNPGEYQLVWDLAQHGGRLFSEMGNLPLPVSVMVGAPTHAVKWEQLQHPIEMVVGSLYTVELRLTNMGAMTWMPGPAGIRLGYHWVRPNGEELAAQPIFTELPRSLDQGEQVQLTARVQAPERAGTFMLKWDLYQGNYNWFSTRGAATLDMPVMVQVIYGAEYVSHDTPTRLISGQKYRVNLRVRNTGTVPWDAEGTVPVLLSYRWYNAAGDEMVATEQVRAALPRTVQPGESVDVAAYLIAPAEPGRFDLEWDLLFADAFWFGEKGVAPLRVPVLIE